MYISVETHDLMCDMLMMWIVGTLALAVLAVLFPSIVSALRRVWRRARLFIQYKHDVAQINRDARRYKAALKVFDKPLRRWSETEAETWR